MRTRKTIKNDDDVPLLWLIVCVLVLIIVGLLAVSLFIHPEFINNKAGRTDGMVPSVAQTMEGAYLLPTAPPFLVEDRVYASISSLPKIMLEIAKCESGLNPRARNKRSNAKGLFQVIPTSERFCEKGLGRQLNMYNPKDNAECAKYLIEHGGLSHWKASKHCWGK